MTTIYLFRHGQTTYNKKGIFTGWSDADLTEEGIAECIRIRKELDSVTPTKAYASDLKRSQKTLYLVLGDKKPQIFIDKRIKERSYGDLTGKNKEEIAKKYPKEYPLWHRSYNVRPPNGESIEDVENRVLEFINDILLKLDKNDIVFISAHGNSLRPIRRYFEKMSIEEMCSFEHVQGKVYKYVL